MLIITNNWKVREYYEGKHQILFIDGNYGDVLKAVRDKIHAGHELLTHPLSGSIKPSETPYESAAVSEAAGRLNFDSLSIIEASIQSYEKFLSHTRQRNHQSYAENTLDDFSEIDLTLLQSALK